MDNEETSDEDRFHADNQARLEKAVEQLREFFECVQILCSTCTDQNTTITHIAGGGNLYARLAQAEKWVCDIKGGWDNPPAVAIDQEPA